MDLRIDERQLDDEAGAFVRAVRLRPDPAAVRRDEVAPHEKAKARAG